MRKQAIRDVLFIAVAMDEWMSQEVSRAQRLAKTGAANGCDVLLTFDGLDDDPREVFDVPEAVQFSERFMADRASSTALVASTTLHPEYKNGGFGRLEMVAMYGGTVVFDGKVLRARYLRNNNGGLGLALEFVHEVVDDR